MARTFSFTDDSNGPVTGLMDAPASVNPMTFQQFVNRVNDKLLEYYSAQAWDASGCAITIDQANATVLVHDGEANMADIEYTAVVNGEGGYDWSVSNGTDTIGVLTPDAPRSNVGRLALDAMRQMNDDALITLYYLNGQVNVEDSGQTVKTEFTPTEYEPPNFTSNPSPQFWEE